MLHSLLRTLDKITGKGECEGRKDSISSIQPNKHLYPTLSYPVLCSVQVSQIAHLIHSIPGELQSQLHFALPLKSSAGPVLTSTVYPALSCPVPLVPYTHFALPHSYRSTASSTRPSVPIAARIRPFPSSVPPPPHLPEAAQRVLRLRAAALGTAWGGTGNEAWEAG